MGTYTKYEAMNFIRFILQTLMFLLEQIMFLLYGEAMTYCNEHVLHMLIRILCYLFQLSSSME